MEIERITALRKLHNINQIDKIPSDLQQSTNKVSTLEHHLHNMKLNKAEFFHIMKNRPLIKYRPARNSFIKKGDKKILANGLGINVENVDNYIQSVIDNDFEVDSDINLKNETKKIEQNDIALTKMYVFRHGKQNQVLKCLKNELKNEKTILNRLYKMFDDNFVGVATYYARPCHILDNKNAKDMYEIIITQLDKAYQKGDITEVERLTAAEFAVRRIHDIQNNPDLRQALKFVWDNN